MTDRLVTVSGSVTTEELAAVLAAVAATSAGGTALDGSPPAAERGGYEAWRTTRLAAVRAGRRARR